VGLTDLTIQGGWNGLTGEGFELNGTTEFTVPLSILNWDDDITLNDVIFNTTGSDGLTVFTSGDIELDNVESRGNSGSGAYLNNTTGGSSVNVTVSDSSFHDNLTGLVVYSFGDISLAYVDGSYNVGAGALIGTARNASITGSRFSWNGEYGLGVNASQDVSVTDVDSRSNATDGAWIISGQDITVASGSFSENSGDGLHALADRMVSITDVDASNNAASGLLVDAGRDATLTDVVASGNGDPGATIWADWNILVDSSVFNENEQDGAYLNSLNGDITVRCSDFESNADYGVEAVLPGLLDLGGDSFVDNGAGDYIVSGDGVALVRPNFECDDDEEEAPTPTATPETMLTLNVVHVLDGETVTLDCVAYIGTVLVLPNGDQVVLPCPIAGQASLAWVDPDQLPGPLDADLRFLSGMDVEVIPSLYGIMTVDFVLPLQQGDESFSVLRWDETEWVDLGGIRTSDGFFEVRSDRDGIFVLVGK
jgi:hypothetical protein